MADSMVERVQAIRDRIASAAARAGRPAGDVTLCAVSKTFPAEFVDAVAAAGVGDIGENKVQEAEGKQPAVRAALRWHLIGHLQSNKARRAIELFDVIQTVDSVKLAERVDRIAGDLGRRPEVYVEVDLAREATKTGAPEENVGAIVDALDRAANVRLVGLMAVPPYFEDPEDVRPYFRRLRELRNHLNDTGRLGSPLLGLSMGMSHDFEVAVEEGATLVRVGTAIFGARG
jgi:pyridoxal phosphate enzyme (YggS family)